jgi:hypothetical protein
MKNLPVTATDYKKKNVAEANLLRQFKSNKVPLFYLIVLSAFLFAACKKQDMDQVGRTQSTNNSEISEDKDFLSTCKGLSKETLKELQQARAATARYQNIKNAFADHYADINVVLQNMGHHYMKAAFVDSVFDERKPELLVYNKDAAGNFELGAVEYAVPLSLSPNVPPAGFTGTGDVWDRNTTFGLWTLHAWVWKFNPDGVFNPMNPKVNVLY